MDNKFNIKDYCQEYEQYITDEYGFKQLSITKFVHDAKECLLKKGYKKILDLGCGSGRNSIYFNKNRFDVYASDINCKVIKENVKKIGIDNINICEHSFTNIPYDDEFFDAVICTSTIHHAIFSDIKDGINEVYRVLRPNGYFIFDIISKEDKSYGLGVEIEKNTFVGSREGEEDVPHHYTDEKELQILLNQFSAVEINKSIYKICELKVSECCFDVIAVK